MYKNLYEKATHTSLSSITLTVAADLPRTLHQMSSTIAFVREQTQTYIAGSILKKLNKILFQNCKYCLNEICKKKVTTNDQLITAREYQSIRKSLKYLSSSFQPIAQ